MVTPHFICSLWIHFQVFSLLWRLWTAPLDVAHMYASLSFQYLPRAASAGCWYLGIALRNQGCLTVFAFSEQKRCWAFMSLLVIFLCLLFKIVDIRLTGYILCKYCFFLWALCSFDWNCLWRIFYLILLNLVFFHCGSFKFCCWPTYPFFSFFFGDLCFWCQS